MNCACYKNDLNYICWLTRFKQANCKMEGSDGTESSTTSTTGSHDSTSSQQQHQQFLGDASGALPNFTEIEPCNPLPDGISKAELKLLEQMYKDHCEVSETWNSAILEPKIGSWDSRKTTIKSVGGEVKPGAWLGQSARTFWRSQLRHNPFKSLSAESQSCIHSKKPCYYWPMK
jgi:hypothetical protein